MANGRVRKWNLRLLISCIIAFCGALLLLVVAWFGWGRLGNLEDPAALATSALATVGGLGGAVFLTVRYREHSLAERQEERDVVIARRQALVDATRLLDSDVVSTRIAGVTILAEIADTYGGTYRQQVVDILCGYLRTKHKEDEKGHATAVESTIMSTIATHLKKSSRPAPMWTYGETTASMRTDEAIRDWCDCTFDFHNAVFTEKVTLNSAIFTKPVNFRGTSFAEYADFWGTQFTGDAIFDSVHFGRDVNFDNVQFYGHTSFLDAHFTGEANFGHAQFDGGGYFLHARFGGDALFGGAQFSFGAVFFGGAQFAGSADFEHANVQLDEATGLPHGAVREDAQA
ncbi:MAG: pentapeptide repeat-containing protein [Ancrocorticia sp.]